MVCTLTGHKRTPFWALKYLIRTLKMHLLGKYCTGGVKEGETRGVMVYPKGGLVYSMGYIISLISHRMD
jgi:hypothetical protein